MNSASKTVAFCIEALTVGGAEQMLVAMANQFIARGWSVHMICLTKEGELADRLDSSVTLHVLHKKPGVDLSLPKRLRALINGINPRCVNSHLWTANLWTRLSLLRSGTPVVVTEHSRDTWKGPHYRLIDRLLAMSTKKLVAVSTDTADFYLTDIKVPKTLVQVINNGVDTKRYAAGNGEQLHKTWAPNDELLIGTVGRMVPAKNHQRFLDLVLLLKDRLPAFKLVLVGDGELREDVEAAVVEKGIQDHILLAGARSDIPDVLAAFDLFVLSSDREGHPLTALEAQAAGTAVVLTNAGGSSDAIASSVAGNVQLYNDGDQLEGGIGGLLVQKDANALADAIALLLNDKERLATMSEFAQTHALASFDMQQMVDQYEILFS